MTFKRGDVVKVGSTLATVIHEQTCGGANGWAVLEWRNPTGYGSMPYDYTMFATDVRLAELDVNVCRLRRWTCSCPLLHVEHPEWLETKKTPTEVGV